MVDQLRSQMNALEAAAATRQASFGAIFSTLLTADSVSRAEIARRTGLSKQTTCEIVRILEDAGWVRPSGSTRGAPGRRALTYRLDARSALGLGVDLGGTQLRLAITDLRGDLLAEARQPTDRRGGRAVVAQIAAMTDELARAHELDRRRLRCGVVGSPGVVQPGSGAIALAPNIPGLDGFDVAGALRAALGCPVTIENDVNLAALGELRHGAPADMAFIALGTGVGMGVLAEGRLLRGARGGAGEIAYLPLGGDPFDSRGFRFGALETAIGSAAIVERYRGHGGDAQLDARGVFDRLAAGDRAAAATLEDVARILTQAIMAVRALLDPAEIVFGGSIGARGELVDRVRALARDVFGDHPAIRVSALGADAALVGALAMAQTRLREGLFEPGGRGTPREPALARAGDDCRGPGFVKASRASAQGKSQSGGRRK